MIVQIGETSGKIWHILDSKGEMTVAKLKTETQADDFLLAAAIGWLARENKVEIDKSGRSLKILLR